MGGIGDYFNIECKLGDCTRGTSGNVLQRFLSSRERSRSIVSRRQAGNDTNPAVWVRRLGGNGCTVEQTIENGPNNGVGIGSRWDVIDIEAMLDAQLKLFASRRMDGFTTLRVTPDVRY